MKRFLTLLMLAGLLFGQDVLTLKNGESYNGTFFGKVDEDIVFKVGGEKSTKKFSIYDVNTIITKNGELTYPFDDPNMKSTEYIEWDYVSPLYSSVDTLLIEIGEDYVSPLEPVLKPVLKSVMYSTLTVAGCYLLVIWYIQASVGTGSGG